MHISECLDYMRIKKKIKKSLTAHDSTPLQKQHGLSFCQDIYMVELWSQALFYHH